MEITVTGQSFAEALAGVLNRIAELNRPAGDATLAVPLRARDSDLALVAKVMATELLAEIGEGSRVGSVRIDGFMKRDGDFICWGYAFTVPEKEVTPSAAPSVRDVRVTEGPGRYEIRIDVEQSGDPIAGE